MFNNGPSLGEIRRQVKSLQRRFAVPLAALRVRRIAEQISDEWGVAVANSKPIPDTNSIIRRIADRGLRFNTFGQLRRYLERCRDAKECPEPRSIATVLLPNAVASGLIYAIFQLDLRPVKDLPPDQSVTWLQSPVSTTH